MSTIIPLRYIGQCGECHEYELPDVVYTGEFIFTKSDKDEVTLILNCNDSNIAEKSTNESQVTLWTGSSFRARQSKCTPVTLVVKGQVHCLFAFIKLNEKLGKQTDMALHSDRGTSKCRWIPSAHSHILTFESKLPSNPVNDSQLVTVNYTNYRGETADRKVLPINIQFKSNEFHKEKQWLMSVYDVERGVHREFAMKDIHSFLPCQ